MHNGRVRCWFQIKRCTIRRSKNTSVSPPFRSRRSLYLTLTREDFRISQHPAHEQQPEIVGRWGSAWVRVPIYHHPTCRFETMTKMKNKDDLNQHKKLIDCKKAETVQSDSPAGHSPQTRSFRCPMVVVGGKANVCD